MTSSSTPAASEPAVITTAAGSMAGSTLATTTTNVGALASSWMSGGNAAGAAMALAGGTGGSQPAVSPGPGLPPIAKRVAELMKAGEYVDFAELPPAKGKGKPTSHNWEGQVVVVQAAELVQARRLIPDYATWSQCFAIFVAVVGQHQPGRIAELMAYNAIIARASRKYRWPSWVVYDQNFRQDAAGNASLSWAKVEPSLYAQCFTGQEARRENWCRTCQSVEHASASCPFQSTRKRAWSGPSGPGSPSGTDDVCRKYNKYNGDCRYGRDCKYKHVCSSCQGAHPAARCKAGAGRPRPEDGNEN